VAKDTEVKPYGVQRVGADGKQNERVILFIRRWGLIPLLEEIALECNDEYYAVEYPAEKTRWKMLHHGILGSVRAFETTEAELAEDEEEEESV
jgi:hypothetical protein